jgi:Uma2 family endonuclease
MYMATTARKLWTVEEVQALPPDGNRYEVIDGDLLVSPAPVLRHQKALRNLFLQIDSYCREHAIGSVFFAPVDVIYGPRTMVEPDLLVLPLINGREPDSVEEAGGLLLVGEVLSPGSAHTDRWRKRLLYQRERVPDYLIIDCDAAMIEQWRPDDERPAVFAERWEWQPLPGVPPFVLDVVEYFRALGGSG